ncbi:hypothetical protein CapIbe_003304 [Capra ibex]
MLCFSEFEPKEDFSLECYVRSWKLVPERAGALSRAAQCRSIALFSFRPGRSKGATFLIFAFCVPGMFSNSWPNVNTTGRAASPEFSICGHRAPIAHSFSCLFA